MKTKCFCGSSHLRAYNPYQHDNIYYLVDGKWVLSDPSLKSYFFSTKRPFLVKCMDCGNDWDEKDIFPQISPRLDHKEIVLDLDHTLFYTEYLSYTDGFDHTFTLDGIAYYIFKRPHLDTFMKDLVERFDKINIYTASTRDYATELINLLNIPSDKLGYIKTRENCVLDRSISFEREYLKIMDNSLMIDDKPLVVHGYNNRVVAIKPYYLDKNDKELLSVLDLLKKKSKDLNQPKFFNGEVNLYLKDIHISFRKLPWDLYKEILKIPTLGQEELNQNQFIRTSYRDPYFVYDQGRGVFSFVDLSYENYLKIYKLVKEYTSHKVIEKDHFDKILEKRYKRVRNNF